MRLKKVTQDIGQPPRAHREHGFSLIELMIVCVILVIICVIAIPNIAQINNNYKLDAAGHSVASLVQQARMQAVQTNLPAYAITTTGSPNMAFVGGTPTAAYAAGSPDVALSPSITFQAPPSTSGFHSQLDTYLGGGTPVINGSIGFNARGLPCTASVTNPAVCTTVAGFEWFMQSNTGGWEAVTVTPAARVKSWRLGSQSNGTYTWQ